MLEIARRPEVATYVHLDERSAAFFALGMGKATEQAAAVVTTSGTAVANLFPAVVEAAQSETPLLLLTADRPPELTGADANQAIDQIGIFGSYVRGFFHCGTPDDRARSLRYIRQVATRAWDAACGFSAGPVHINLPFRKPLEPRGDGASAPRVEHAGTRVHDSVPGIGAAGAAALRDFVGAAERGLLVAGPKSACMRADTILELARATGFPVLADPLSGVRAGLRSEDLVVAGYDLLLRSPEVRAALRPDAVLRVGRNPTSQRVLDWLEEAAVPQLVIDSGRVWKDHLSLASVVVRASASAALDALPADRAHGSDDIWRRSWRTLSDVARTEIPEALLAHPCEGTVAYQVGEALPPEANLFLSNSMPVRDADAYLLPRTRMLHVFGNRGASGIDGITSTVLGIAAASGRPTVGLLGDVAFFHDLNGLMAARHVETPCVLVLVNNDGGGIFGRLPIRSFEPAFTEFFTTPHGLDFQHATRLHGLPHAVVAIEDLTNAVSGGLQAGGVRVIEVRIDRNTQDRTQKEVEARVATAGETALRELQPRGS